MMVVHNCYLSLLSKKRKEQFKKIASSILMPRQNLFAGICQNCMVYSVGTEERDQIETQN